MDDRAGAGGAPDDRTSPATSGTRTATDPTVRAVAQAAGPTADQALAEASTLTDAPPLAVAAERDQQPPRRHWSARRLSRARRRAPGPPARRRLALLCAALTLLALLLPSLAAASSLYQDYTSIRGLAEDGLHHLLAAEGDLASLAALRGSLSLGSTPPVAPSAASAPYTLEVQRQAGTDYAVRVTVRPSAALARVGDTLATFTTTLGTNTAFAYGAPAAVRPPAATPTATATPAASGPSGATSDAASLIPAPGSLDAALGQCRAAQADFAALLTRLASPGWALGTGEHVPGVSGDVATAVALARAGADAATMGVQVIQAALAWATRLHGQPLAASELLTQADITRFEAAITQLTPEAADLQSQLAGVALASLPLSASQRAQLARLRAELPTLRALLAQAGPIVAAVGWLLGTDAPRYFLVQTLDQTELRASGGFAGNFGELTVRNGKLAPFTLTTVERTDYSYGRWYDGWVYGRRPPALYPWWPIADWGLRDANLSADFPTTARLVMDVFQRECAAACQAAGVSPRADGVIEVTPAAIAHVLAITGPLYVPGYDETVTAANLEAKLHYYQLDPAGLAKQQALSGSETSTSIRKAFTDLVGQLLERRLQHLPAGELLAVARGMLADLRSKDIQVYVTNATIESLLEKGSLAGTLDTTAGRDGFMIVQTNVTAAKANPCVTVSADDAVTLDDSGGATHHLTITMRKAVGACDPYRGEFTTYHAYLRIYVPPQARLERGDGFDQLRPRCAGASCGADPYPGGELACPAGGYLPGAETNIIAPMGDPPGVLDQLGDPTQTTSDVPGRAMWGGFVTIPPLCTATLTLTWYVPRIVSLASTAHPAKSS